MKTGPGILLASAIFVLLMAAVPAHAAGPPALLWETVAGGSGYDVARDVCQTADGGYIVVGTSGRAGASTATGGDTDVMVVRLRPSGNLLWQKKFGGTDTDGGAAIQQTADGGYVLVGYTTVSRESGRYAPTVTTSRYGSRYNEYTQETGYVTVTRDRQVWVINLDAGGEIRWQKILGGYGEDEGSDIRQTADGGFILTGHTYSDESGDVGSNHGASDAWVVRLTPTGDLWWQRTLGGNAVDTGSSIRQTADGGYILAGQTASDGSGNVGPGHGDYDAWVVKLSAAGDVQWQKTLGGSAADSGSCIRQTADGGYILIGSTSSDSSGDVGKNHGSTDAWAVNLDASGNIKWQRTLGGDRGDQGAGIQQTADGGYILAGYSASDPGGDAGRNHGAGDFWVVKLDAAGTVLWQKLLGGDRNEQAWSIRQTADGGYILAGSTESGNTGDVGTNSGLADFWIVRLAPDPAGPAGTPAPSAGQVTGTYKVGFDGMRYNADGRQRLDLDLAKARQSLATVSVYTDRVEVYQKAPDGVLITFRGSGFTVQGDRITGAVQYADLVTDAVKGPLAPGIVSGAVRAALPELTQQGTLKAAINDTPAHALADRIRAVITENGGESGTIAYTYDIRKSSLPAGGVARVNLSLPGAWVDSNGGAGSVRIVRVSDATGAAELLPVTVAATDEEGRVYFEGVSVNGTSVFGLVTLKASGMAGNSGQSSAQPAVATFLGLLSWLLNSVQQNPAGALAVVACAGAAWAGRRRGMW